MTEAGRERFGKVVRSYYLGGGYRNVDVYATRSRSS